MLTLYPPYIEAKQKAFVNVEKGRIYFNTSILNTIDEVKFLQVAINRVDNNENVLDKIWTGSGSSYNKLYPTGYLFMPVVLNSTVFYDGSNGLYYFDLPLNLLVDKNYYKIQIRFGQTEVTPAQDGFWQTNGEIINNAWLSTASNVKSMSEWSTVSIFKVLSEINVEIQDLDLGIVNNVDTSVYTFIGTIDMLENSNEAVASTKFSLYENAKLIETSGTIAQPANQKLYNYYTFNTILENNVSYVVGFEMTTISGYTKKVEYRIIPKYSVLPPTYTIEEYSSPYSNNNVDLYKTGVNLLIKDRSYKDLSAEELKLKPNYYIIRKTSSKSNFEDWEEIAKIRSTPGISALEYKYFDGLIESGVEYKYTVQSILLNTGRGLVSEPLLVKKDYDHTWLVCQNNLYFQIDYNLNISNYKKNIKETKIETLGSKYPFFVRNGNMNYRSFSVSGMLVSDMDIEGKLTNKEGYIKERDFRRKMEEILMDGKPKVFKSTTEEMMLVYISDVTLTPNTTLGRTIYDFSCTFTEIGEITTENLKQYEILPTSPLGLGEDLRVPAIVGYIGEHGRLTPDRAIVGVY